MSAKILPFPDCSSESRCIQDRRIGTIETQIGSLDAKLDRILWWIITLAVSVAGGAIATLVAVLMQRIK